MEKLVINSEYIRLCDALKFANLVETGGVAKMLILDGYVTVNGEVCLQKCKKLHPGDRFAIDGEEQFETQ